MDIYIYNAPNKEAFIDVIRRLYDERKDFKVQVNKRDFTYNIEMVFGSQAEYDYFLKEAFKELHKIEH